MSDEKKKILALDDQQSMRNILSFALKKVFDIETVGTFDEAVQKGKSGAFEMVLLDIVLDNDKDDSIGVATEIQNSGANVPVAFLTSLAPDSLEPDQKERADKLNNVKFYQTKPINPPELIEKIKNVIG